MTGYHNF